MPRASLALYIRGWLQQGQCLVHLANVHHARHLCDMRELPWQVLDFKQRLGSIGLQTVTTSAAGEVKTMHTNRWSHGERNPSMEMQDHEELKTKAAEEAAAAKKAVHDARVKAAAKEAAIKAAEEAAAAKKAANNAAKTAEEDAARMKASEETAVAKKAAEEEAAKMKASDEETARMKAAEEEAAARMKAAEEETARMKAAEEEAARMKVAEEAAAAKKAVEEETARMEAAEEAAALEKAAEAAKVKAAEDARAKAEADEAAKMNDARVKAVAAKRASEQAAERKSAEEASAKKAADQAALARWVAQERESENKKALQEAAIRELSQKKLAKTSTLTSTQVLSSSHSAAYSAGTVSYRAAAHSPALGTGATREGRGVHKEQTPWMQGEGTSFAALLRGSAAAETPAETPAERKSAGREENRESLLGRKSWGSEKLNRNSAKESGQNSAGPPTEGNSTSGDARSLFFGRQLGELQFEDGRSVPSSHRTQTSAGRDVKDEVTALDIYSMASDLGLDL